MKECCKDFKKVALNYLDLSVEIDMPLQLLVSFLYRITDENPLEVQDFRSIAKIIEIFLNKKLVLEHEFFGRSIHSATFDEIELEAEKFKIQQKINANNDSTQKK